MQPHAYDLVTVGGRGAILAIYDMHCHLTFASNGCEVARAAELAGIGALSATVTPADYETARAAIAGVRGLRAGVGLHPWCLANGTCAEGDLARFEELCRSTRFIGEIGLDLAGDNAKSRGVQIEALGRMLRACDASGDRKLITLHAVRGTTDLLDALERCDATRNHDCALHWFSGTSDELTRARRLGCFFSVNARMLETKRGRAYARAIPAERLLLETDEPPTEGFTWSADAWKTRLEETLAVLAAARGEDASALGAAIAATSARLLEA